MSAKSADENFFEQKNKKEKDKAHTNRKINQKFCLTFKTVEFRLVKYVK